MASSYTRRRRRAAAASTSARAARRSRPAAPLPIPLPFRRVRSQLDSSSRFDEPILASDRRAWIPEPYVSRRGSARAYHWQLDYAPAARVSGQPARVIAPAARRDRGKPRLVREVNAGALVFAAPQRVVVCVQRNQRKEVLHAMGVAGGRVRTGRRSGLSAVRCR